MSEILSSSYFFLIPLVAILGVIASVWILAWSVSMSKKDDCDE